MPLIISRTIKKFVNHFLAFSSLTRTIILNILGAGGLLALKGAIESFDENKELNHVFMPIYYTSLGLLSIWQILELTVWSKSKYTSEKELVGINVSQQSLARNYPVHYLADEFKKFVPSYQCYKKSFLKHSGSIESETNSTENQVTTPEFNI